MGSNLTNKEIRFAKKDVLDRLYTNLSLLRQKKLERDI